MPKLYQNKTWLRLKYVSQGKSITEIAKEAGCSIQTVQNYLEKFGLIRGGRTWAKR